VKDSSEYYALLTREAWLWEEYRNLKINGHYSNSTGNLTRDLEGMEKNVEEFETMVNAFIADLQERKERVRNALEFTKHEFLK
jgi:hypothetical protein